ncbi:uncharacterized protein HHUB_4129 (plasmid) [Halobacterium hubeiense]|uniref:Uncharacterized protein n=1 Tax=Halobacterium hubeiense TaxID=1407499 RepID=A0A0U5H8B2_9EURY|nr:hypothetical protein [Halobacterium hubeiense]CQH63586.1 uncharacterized protein HHUB_4129 [Halobacterium hubeiense]
MNEASETDPPDAGGLPLRSIVSRDLLGIVLCIVGAYGLLVFSGRVSVVLAGVNGIGAVLIFTSGATTSTNSAGYFVALGSWSLLALSGLTTRIAIPILLTAFWFGFKAERQIWTERINAS